LEKKKAHSIVVALKDVLEIHYSTKNLLNRSTQDSKDEYESIVYSYFSMRYKSPIWSCTLKCILSCAGLWFLIVVLKIMLSPTIEVTSQSFAQTIDEMILLLSALVIIVGGDQYDMNLKRIIEDINNKLDKKDKNINITNKSDVIQ
jgi:hypothetical protein